MVVETGGTDLEGREGCSDGYGSGLESMREVEAAALGGGPEGGGYCCCEDREGACHGKGASSCTGASISCDALRHELVRPVSVPFSL